MASSSRNVFALVKNNPRNIIACNSEKYACLVFTRGFKPYTRVPKKFLERIKVDRYKTNRDDVYFVEEQVHPIHNLSEAIDVMKAYDLFGGQPVDVLMQINLGEGKHKIGVLKGLINLPTPVNVAQKILVFAEGEDAVKAKAAGASIVGGKELIPQIEEGSLQFDHCISTLDFLPNIKHLPRVLKNKMPNTRRGTATGDIVSAMQHLSHGETYIADRNGLLRHTIGTTEFTPQHIQENLNALLQAIESHRKTKKGAFYNYLSVLTPTGPRLDLDIKNVVPT